MAAKCSAVAPSLSGTVTKIYTQQYAAAMSCLGKCKVSLVLFRHVCAALKKQLKHVGVVAERGKMQRCVAFPAGISEWFKHLHLTAFKHPGSLQQRTKTHLFLLPTVLPAFSNKQALCMSPSTAAEGRLLNFGFASAGAFSKTSLQFKAAAPVLKEYRRAIPARMNAAFMVQMILTGCREKASK